MRRQLPLSFIVLGAIGAAFVVLQALGRRGIVGSWLERVAGIQLTFTTAGAVIAATFVSIPLVVLSAEAGFRSIDPRFEGAAAVLGAKPGYTLRRVILPMAAPQLVAGGGVRWGGAPRGVGATIPFARAPA